MDVGEPDLRIYKVKDGVQHCLYLELKSAKGYLSDSQKSWKEDYDNRRRGWNTCYAVAFGLDEAMQKIIQWDNDFYVDSINTEC